VLLQSKRPQVLSNSFVFCTTNLLATENTSGYHHYYLKGLPQLLQFRLPNYKKYQLVAKFKIKEHFSFKLSKDVRKP